MSHQDVKCRSAEGLLTLLSLLASTRERHGVAVGIARRIDCLGELAQTSPARLQELCGSATCGAALGLSRAVAEANDAARAILDRTVRASLRVVTVFDVAYPSRLGEIAHAPAVLFMKGELDPASRSVACVGTRSPTRFGEVVAERLVTFLASHGWSIVSGLALGIDSIAHRAALDVGGHTVAVLGHGLDRVAPAQHRGLAREIVERGGALVSQEPTGFEVTAERLVLRNRLLSGLSVAVILFQSGMRGGSLHTARFALLQGRRIFAPVPVGAHALEPRSRALKTLTECDGARLARELRATGELARRLRGSLAHRRLFTPIRGRAEYPSLLAELEELVGLDR